MRGVVTQSMGTKLKLEPFSGSIPGSGTGEEPIILGFGFAYRDGCQSPFVCYRRIHRAKQFVRRSRQRRFAIRAGRRRRMTDRTAWRDEVVVHTGVVVRMVLAIGARAKDTLVAMVGAMELPEVRRVG